MFRKTIILQIFTIGFLIPIFSNAQLVPESNPNKFSLELGILSAPTREIWGSLSVGLKLQRQYFSLALLAPELRGAYHRWSLANGYELSSKIAFGVGHRFVLWEKNRWSMETNSVFQIQNINIYETDVITPVSMTKIGNYPRLQLSTGLGLRFSFLKHFNLFYSVRYGIARGNFFIVYPQVNHWRASICSDIAFGIRL